MIRCPTCGRMLSIKSVQLNSFGVNENGMAIFKCRCGYERVQTIPWAETVQPKDEDDAEHIYKKKGKNKGRR